TSGGEPHRAEWRPGDRALRRRDSQRTVGDTKSSTIAITSATAQPAPAASVEASSWTMPTTTPLAATTCGTTEPRTRPRTRTVYALTFPPWGTLFRATTSEATSPTTAMTPPPRGTTPGRTTMGRLRFQWGSVLTIPTTTSLLRLAGTRATRGTASTMGWPPTTTGRVSIRQSTLRSRAC